MGAFKYCFMMIGEGLSPENCTGSFASDTFEVNVYGVETDDAACEVAKKEVDNGVELIELCGDFDQEKAQKISAAIDNRADVRFVNYDNEELIKLKTMTSDENYAFIIMVDGFNPGMHQIALLDGTTKIIGVSNLEQACEQAKQLAGCDIDFIELCSAFDCDMAAEVIAAVNGKVPVGYARK